MTKRVLLYGISANPPTGFQGHLGALRHLKSLYDYDEIWLLPVYQHIYSTKRNLAPFEHRIQMCKLAVTALPNEGAQIFVKESEKELFDVTKAKTKIEDRSTIRLGSIDLIRFLLDTNPNINFTMLLGADTYQDLEAGKWKSGDELMRLIRFVVMDREGYTNISEQKTPSSSCENVEFISIPSLGPVSSTMARQAKDYETLSTIVVPSVANYIIEHQLYAFSPDQTN